VVTASDRLPLAQRRKRRVGIVEELSHELEVPDLKRVHQLEAGSLLARALVPGPQPMGLLSTMLLGVGGSLLGGILGSLLFGGRWDHPATAGWIGSVLLLAAFGRSGSRMFRALTEDGFPATAVKERPHRVCAAR
jgi:uncharacterized membrane protein YeaQ/YmgE (transglycosylase-associated protein family)